MKVSVWQKATDELPDVIDTVHLRIDGRPGFGRCYLAGDEMVFGFTASNGFGTLYPHQFDMVEWLKELEINLTIPNETT